MKRITFCLVALCGFLFNATLQAQSSNDECANAINLDSYINTDGTCTLTYTGSISSADTNSVSEVPISSGCTYYATDPTPKDIWFSLTVPSTGGFYYDDIVTPGISSIVEVYTGSCGSLTAYTPTLCNNSSTQKLFGDFTPGETVYIRYWDYGSDDSGSLEFCITAIASCVDPSNLAVANLTTTSADLSWTQANGAALFNIEIVDVTAGGSQTMTPTQSGVSNPYSLMGLTPSNEYEYYVQADCNGDGSDLSAWAGPFAFTTLCTDIIPDYVTDFDLNVPDSCWDEADAGEVADGPSSFGSSSWYASSYTDGITYQTNAINLYSNNKRDWLLSPSFDLSSGGPYQLDVHVRHGGTSTLSVSEPFGSDDEVQLLMSIDGGTTWTNITTWDINNDPGVGGQDFTQDLSAITGSVRFALFGNDGTVNDAEDTYFHISKFVVRATPSCADVSNITVDGTTDSSVTFSWTAGGSETTWEYVVQAAGTGIPGGSGTQVTGTPSATEPGLSANTDYEIYVRSDCGGGDFGSWIGPVNFTTPCSPFTAPYSQNFDGTTDPEVDACWTIIENFGNTTSERIETYNGTSPSANSAPNSIEFYNSSGNYPGDGELILVSPQFSDFGNDKRIRFYLYDETNTTQFIVGTMSDPTDPSTFTAFQTFTDADMTDDVWEEQIVYFDTYAGSDQYVAFLMASANDYDYMYLDDFVYEVIPTCPDPLDLVVNPSTVTDATITWTQGFNETDWTYEYGTTGFTQGTGTSGMVSTTPTVDVSSLTPGETYDIYVQANCGGGDSGYVMTTWTQPNYGDFCASPIVATVESDCSTATPITIDYAIAADLGAAASCDTTTGNTGAWFEFVAPASGAVNVSFSVTNEYALFDACGGTELVCVSSATNLAELNGLTPSATYYLAMWKDSATTGTVDVCFEEVLCADPSGMAASNIMESSANLTWMAGGTESDWNLEWKAGADFTPGNSEEDGSDTATGTPAYSASGLTADTTYYVYYQSDCGSSTSAWIGPFTFTTACTTFVAPYTEDFENAGSLPSCWMLSGAENWNFSNTGSGNHIGSNGTINGSTISGGYFAWVDSSGTQADAILTSPFIDVSALTTPAIYFYELSDNEGYDNSQLEVEVWDGASWVSLAIYDTNTTNDSWEQKIIDLTSLTITGPIQVRFIFTEVIDPSDFYDDIAIDDVSVDNGPSCFDPSNLSASNITDVSADLSWADTNGSSMFNIEIVDVTGGGSQTMTPTYSGVSNPYTAMGLTPSNDYDFYVQVDCGGGELSNWVGPYSFTTECSPFTPNFVEDFSVAVAPDCWMEGNNTSIVAGANNSDGSWLQDDYLNNTSNGKAARFNLYTTNAAGEGDWLVTPMLDLSAGGYGLFFNVGLTAYASTSPETPNLMGSDDEVQLLISDDNGATWANLETFNVSNAPSHLGENRLYDLSAYTSATTRIAFWATHGTVDDAEDVDFFVDNFRVDTYSLLSVDDINSNINLFTYYPNPVNATLNIKSQRTIEKVSIFNVLGQEVSRTTPQNVTSEIDMTDLTSGAYFIKVTVEGISKTIRIIKQ